MTTSFAMSLSLFLHKLTVSAYGLIHSDAILSNTFYSFINAHKKNEKHKDANEILKKVRGG